MDVEKLRELFSRYGNAEKAVQGSAYLRNQFKSFGIPTKLRRELTKAFDVSDDVDWDFVFALWAAEEREMQYSAIDHLVKHKKRLTKADIPNLKKLATTKSWWDTVDCIDTIIGDIALKDSSVNEILLAWSVDDNFWLRRIAIDHQLMRKDKTDAELLGNIIKNNLNQTEFFINKAIGWALRQYARTNPDWVREFIAENRDGMSKLSVREASKYL
jgi:3-methyladenine DNA glycosylase AlkD